MKLLLTRGADVESCDQVKAGNILSTMTTIWYVTSRRNETMLLLRGVTRIGGDNVIEPDGERGRNKVS